MTTERLHPAAPKRPPLRLTALLLLALATTLPALEQATPQNPTSPAASTEAAPAVPAPSAPAASGARARADAAEAGRGERGEVSVLERAVTDRAEGDQDHQLDGGHDGGRAGALAHLSLLHI